MSAMVLHPAGRPAASARRRAAGAAPLHLTARGRAVVVALGLLLVAALVMVGSRAAADGPVSGLQVQRHVVAPGETLWQIAASVTAPGHDVRETVADLVHLNDLPGAGLRAGQVVVVPVD